MMDSLDALETLRASRSPLAKTIEAVESLQGNERAESSWAIGLSSNVSVGLLPLFLKKHALLNGVSLAVDAGNHDDLVNDVDRYTRLGIQTLLYLPFFDNLLPCFEKQLGNLPQEKVNDKLLAFRAECLLAFSAGADLDRIFVTSFHRFSSSTEPSGDDIVRRTVDAFNECLRTIAKDFPNVTIIDTESIVRELGAGAAFDRRFYIRSSAPYSPDFLDELARRISVASRGFGTYFYKALVLDGDNTLWGGILGEDLLDGVHLDMHGFPGRVYWEAQLSFKALEARGVLLCLCSKNNPKDVSAFLETHPSAVLSRDDFVISKVNWENKVSNVREIAKELNLGLESLVFLDDSDFECASVTAELPQVRVMQVPSTLSSYADTIRQIEELFLSGGITSESSSKTSQYRQVQQARASQAQFSSHEQYLASLNLRVALARDKLAAAGRISELTQKSNQFNLTTLRQTVTDIRRRMSDPASSVYSISVSDKFGSSGLTGVVLIRWRGELGFIEAFLLSCRVLGRGIEYCIWPSILEDAIQRGCRTIEAEYRPSAKNMQVADFYDQIGLQRIPSSEGAQRYRGVVNQIAPPQTTWIEVEDSE